MSLPTNSIFRKEVLESVMSLKNKKCPGYDNITAQILKQLFKKGIMLITAIFNAILRTGRFPAQWKIAQIIMIPKLVKNPTKVTSYRPINLLPQI